MRHQRLCFLGGSVAPRRRHVDGGAKAVQWQQRFVVVLGKLTMDVSRGFGGKFTRMCFGSGISSSTSGTAKGSIYSLWLSFVCTCLEPGRVKADICHWL